MEKQVMQALPHIWQEMPFLFLSLLNDKELHKKLLPALVSTFCEENIIETEAMLGGEDFAFYSRKISSMFYFIGAEDDAGKSFFVHHPKVVINEE